MIYNLLTGKMRHFGKEKRKKNTINDLWKDVSYVRISNKVLEID
jgi:hypothetical protein